MKKIVSSLLIVLSLDIFGSLSTLNRNFVQSEEFTKEEQYLVDNEFSSFAEDIRNIRLGKEEYSHGNTYENLIKFTHDLFFSETQELFYEKKEGDDFHDVVTTDSLNSVPIEGFSERVVKAIAAKPGSIREDYGPGNRNNMNIYVRYNPVSTHEEVLKGMRDNEPGSLIRYLNEISISYGQAPYDMAGKVINHIDEVDMGYARGWLSIDGLDMDAIATGTIPAFNEPDLLMEHIDRGLLDLYMALVQLDESSMEYDMLLLNLAGTIHEEPLGLMYHNKYGWVFVVLELVDRDALNAVIRWWNNDRFLEDFTMAKEDNISPAMNSDYLYPSNNTYITDEFLYGKDSKTLGLIRNEIYARHGYIFRNFDYQNYFGSKGWYNPNPNFTENLLNNIERDNIKKVQEYEKRVQNNTPVPSNNNTNQYYLFPSNTNYITESFLNGCSKEEVALIRNEIYARHGYVFNRKEYKDYFGSMSWYRPNPNFSENLFNNIEKENIKRIRAYEKKRGW